MIISWQVVIVKMSPNEALCILGLVVILMVDAINGQNTQLYKFIRKFTCSSKNLIGNSTMEGNILESVELNSEIACARKCVRTDHCGSFVFSGEKRSCKLLFANTENCPAMLSARDQYYEQVENVSIF